jgi:hypothetical protein
VMPCFEPVLTIARRLLVDHRLGEGVHPVDDAPQIDPEHALPALIMVPRAAARRGAGIVHQHRNPAERGVGPLCTAHCLKRGNALLRGRVSPILVAR